MFEDLKKLEQEIEEKLSNIKDSISLSSLKTEVFGKKGKASNNDYEGPETDGHKNMIDEFLKQTSSSSLTGIDLVEDTMTLLNALYESSQKQTAVSGKFSKALQKN